jgi:hypothetical protein
MKNNQKRNYDWEAIHKDYRTARFDSDRELCRYWDVPPSTFRKKKKGDPEKGVPAWKRDLEGRFKNRVKNQSIQELAQQSAQPVPSGQKLDDDERTVEDAANAAMVILRRHQKKINDLETISEELRGVLLNAFLNQDPDSIIAWNGGKAESASDMLVKLTKVASDLIKLERQAFNLDDHAVQGESKGITIDKIEIIGVDPEDDLGNS